MPSCRVLRQPTRNSGSNQCSRDTWHRAQPTGNLPLIRERASRPWEIAEGRGFSGGDSLSPILTSLGVLPICDSSGKQERLLPL